MAENESRTNVLHKGGTYAQDVNIGNIVNATAATLTIDPVLHSHRVITLNRAGGIAVTLPPALGTGDRYTFIVGTTITTSSTIKVTTTDIMTGVAINAQDSADTAVMWETAADTDTITLDGSTTGGIKGDKVELLDMAAALWYVNIQGSATSTEATPFSATV